MNLALLPITWDGSQDLLCRKILVSPSRVLGLIRFELF